MTTTSTALTTPWRFRALQAREQARVLVPRFDVHQRAQHLVMLCTFMALAATGLPQKFGSYGASRWWIDVLGGLDVVRTIHRTAGLVMLTDCLYHVSYVMVRVGFQGRFEMFRMIPTIQDAQNMLASFAYALGITRERPQFDRFSYLEKFDYWAVFWGIAVIGTSGIILLFPVQAAGLLTGPALPAALAAHSDEALLAVGWIFTVHLFYVFLAPESFPLNTAMFTGRMPAHRHREAHPLEHQRLFSTSPLSSSERPARFQRWSAPPRHSATRGRPTGDRPRVRALPRKVDPARSFRPSGDGRGPGGGTFRPRRVRRGPQAL